ncbi:MarR family transcriptional regulator [Paraburkholderia sprentiae WSM5005]|uniref:MarR family transcriptional regulator n=1 Tax=Paraburkholderia sprentiae WSM5005 TaxID=754502 RepID=A0A1I9YQ70_9BURK|nr:MarR family transcriptional regulator [Paraburkholderia sprentiae]APA88358.1 MarR family transcriptional regulator [Paraburkholderia sprentiae WSM5005]
MNRLPPSYDECNCFALRQAARHVTQIYERHLSSVGLTAAQFTILAKLARTPNLPMAELADAMVMERTTLVRAMKPLQRDGLVLAEAADHDNRTLLFSLTDKGETTFDQASVAWRAAQEEFEKKFGRARAKTLRAELFSVTG